jgi:choline dehydrogenase-like flavoprotein
MRREVQAVSRGAGEQYDICIIGGGPAGLTVARALEGSGLSVVVLETGGWPAREQDVALARARSVGHPYFPVHTTRVRGLAGTSNHWYHDVGFRARPLDPVDFEARDEVPHSGWPFGRELLDPFYARAHEVCGLGAFDYAPESYSGLEAGPMLELGPDVVTSVFKLVPTDIFQRLGQQLLDGPTTHVVLGATVTELLVDGPQDELSGVRVRMPDGAEHEVGARAYVLAAGGIDNARLLLASRSRLPAGIGNGSDLVGRFFMEHLSVRSGDWRPADRAHVDGPSPYRAHVVGDLQVHAKLSPAEDVVRRRGLLNSTFFLDAMDDARASAGTLSTVTLKHALVDRPRPPHLAAHAATVVRHLPDVVRVARRQLAHRRGRGSHFPDTMIQLRAMSEQAPNPLSRVTLDDTRDAFGVPLAKLDWQLTELDRRSVREAQDVIDAALQQAGLGRLERKLGEERPAAEQRGQWHHMGTTRMHDDPRQGVVDRDGLVHGMRNLFVAGSSVFPTSGYANPTLTVVALALRLADDLRARRWPS